MEDKREIYVPAMNPGQVTAPSKEIFAAMGEASIFLMLEDFYAELARSEIAHFFPSDPDKLRTAAHKSAAFFVGLLGGPPLYHERHGNPMMRARHMPFQIDPAGRAIWLACFERVLERAPQRYQFPSAHMANFRLFLNEFSMWMVNTRPTAAT